jgi:hypothetical protein
MDKVQKTAFTDYGYPVGWALELYVEPLMKLIPAENANCAQIKFLKRRDWGTSRRMFAFTCVLFHFILVCEARFGPGISILAISMFC